MSSYVLAAITTTAVVSLACISRKSFQTSEKNYRVLNQWITEDVPHIKQGGSKEYQEFIEQKIEDFRVSHDRADDLRLYMKGLFLTQYPSKN